MNSVVLDVVIGLVFIYLIYSLFISIVGEMISNWLGMRARVLRQGITNLLTDIQHKNDGFNFFRNIGQYFLNEPKDFEHSSLGQEPEFSPTTNRSVDQHERRRVLLVELLLPPLAHQNFLNFS